MGSTFKVFVAWSALHTGLIERRRVHHRQRHVQGRVDRGRRLRPGHQVRVAQLVLLGHQRAVPLRADQHAAVARRLQRRVLLPPRRAVLRHARDRSPAAAERAAQLRVRRRDRHRPALRVRRPPARPRDQGRPRRERGAGQGRGTTCPPRRRDQPGDRPGPAGGDADAAGRRLRRVRQRRLRDAAPCRRGDLRAEHARLARRNPASSTSPAPWSTNASRRPAGRSRWTSPTRSSNGIRQNITGPGTAANTTTAEELFNVNWSEPAAPPIAGKTGTAQGRFSFPWNDSSVFAAFSQDSDAAVDRGVVPREGRVRLARLGARRQVHVPGAVRGHGARSRRRSPSRSTPTSEMAAQPQPPLTDLSCMESTNANTIYPGPVVTGRPAD